MRGEGWFRFDTHTSSGPAEEPDSSRLILKRSRSCCRRVNRSHVASATADALFFGCVTYLLYDHSYYTG